MARFGGGRVGESWESGGEPVMSRGVFFFMASGRFITLVSRGRLGPAQAQGGEHRDRTAWMTNKHGKKQRKSGGSYKERPRKGRKLTRLPEFVVEPVVGDVHGSVLVFFLTE